MDLALAGPTPPAKSQPELSSMNAPQHELTTRETTEPEVKDQEAPRLTVKEGDH